MSQRVPRGGLGPEWPSEPDDGQAQEHQGAQRNGNGAPGQDQQRRQYGQYGEPGRSGPAGYGQHQPYGGQGGNGHGPQGYDQPGPPPDPGPGYDNQPQTFSYQGRGATYREMGTRAAATARRLRRLRRRPPRLPERARARKHAPVRGPAAIRRPALPAAGAGAWWPGIPWGAVTGRPAGQEGPVSPDSPVLPPSYRPHRQRRYRALPPRCHVLRWPGGVQEQWPGCVGEPRGMGQGPLPRPGRDVRRVAVLQPAAEGRQAAVLARRAQRRGGQPGQASEGQRQEGFRARHPGHAEVPRGLVDRRRRPVAGGGKGQRRARRS